MSATDVETRLGKFYKFLDTVFPDGAKFWEKVEVKEFKDHCWQPSETVEVNTLVWHGSAMCDETWIRQIFFNEDWDCWCDLPDDAIITLRYDLAGEDNAKTQEFDLP